MDKEYPQPNLKGWEEQYRFAKAFEKSATSIVQFVVGLKNQHDTLAEKENEVEKSLDD